MIQNGFLTPAVWKLRLLCKYVFIWKQSFYGFALHSHENVVRKYQNVNYDTVKLV